MVFYRKYRPQTIEQLDLDSSRERLTSILKAKELPHAFLFTGPKGLGKTSSARILAKAINCENKKGIEPCNECEACKTITNGSNLDVIEIDAASNRGIDEIRDLREKIKYSPSTLSKKVYIIDEVHMLTNDAFNALLKTLEEPPDHAVFILCTTEIEKVPPTIVSRAFHVEFRKPTLEELKRSLGRIVSGENLNVEEGVLDKIFMLSEGSFRDAAKILEDLSFSDEKKITLERVEKSYKTGSIEHETRALLKALFNKDLQGSLSIIENLAQKGIDFKVFTEKLAEVLHSSILASVGIGAASALSSNSQQEMNDLLSKINDSYKNIKFSVLPQMPLEIVIVEWCLKGVVVPEKKQTVVIEKETIVVEAPREEVKVSESLPEKVVVEEKKEEVVVKEEAPVRDHGDLFKENAKPENFFAMLLSSLKHDNHSIAGILRGCKLVEITKEQAIFETKYKFHRDKLSDIKVGHILNTHASDILKENIRVVVNLVEK